MEDRNMADSKGTFDTLLNLIETCRNGQTGYLHAAAKIKDPVLKSFFEGQSSERGRFAVELTAEAEKLGRVESNRFGTVTGMMHRAWFTIKADFGGSDQGILGAVVQGEERARDNYERAAAAMLPAEVRPLIERQYQSVKAAYDTLHSWGRKTSAKSG
jgi:uncharacterized protein (TIGR02284 family)